MNAALRVAYVAAGRFVRAAAHVVPPAENKLLRALSSRCDVRARYVAWSRASRDRARPLLWMHAPSVGEGLQARPVIERAHAQRPGWQLAYTYFSPSAESFAQTLRVDFTDVLPFDVPGDAAVTIDALAPRALVFSKLDLWPVFVQAASRRGVQLGMISATLSAHSSRLGVLARALLRDAYGQLDAVGAIGDEDAERLVSLGVRRSAITVTGDTRYDQVWAKARAVNRGAALLAPLTENTRITLVAGSTWPADERVLLPAWEHVRRSVPNARLIIAPHEPTPSHLQPIEQWARAASASVARLGAPGAATADVVLVDRVGVLGDLYALADVAYVGGGFHAAGLHSVLEPAAFGAPVAFGPLHANSRDAGLLLAAHGGASVTDTATLGNILIEWLRDDTLRTNMGANARTLVERGLGAADRSFALVDALMQR